MSSPGDKSSRVIELMDRLNDAVMTVPPTVPGRADLELAWDNLHGCLVDYIRANRSTPSATALSDLERLGKLALEARRRDSMQFSKSEWVEAVDAWEAAADALLEGGQHG